MGNATIDTNSAIIDTIVSDIEKESCVLIVGPDLANFGEKTFFEMMCDDLRNDVTCSQSIDLSPQYVFLHEELLQLVPPARETTLLRYMERFYNRQTQFDEVFRKISQIPFHLIVSFLPDGRLKTVYKSQNLKFEYSHYPLEESPEPVKKPTKDCPMLYNILGDFSESEVIITFDHLFQYLSGIMGKRELPQAIQETFKRARTFLFLGVHFERWYVQLILRIITMKEKRDKFSILRKGGSSEVYAFMARRLELDFMEMEPIEFLDQLFDACSGRNLLKDVARVHKASVFISYSHQNMDVAQRVKAFLNSKDIEVFRDEENMPGGQRIVDFINVIDRVDTVLVLISKDSLLSPWVTKEVLMTLDKKRATLVPCYLDSSFMDKSFVEIAGPIVDAQIDSIDERIKQRGRGNTEDLSMDRNRWSEYFSNLPRVLLELNARKCISLQPHELDEGLSRMLTDVLKNK